MLPVLPGITDKNLEKVYENDRVLRNGHVRIVTFKDGSFYLFPPAGEPIGLDDCSAIHHGWHLNNYNDIEITSNIHDKNEQEGEK